MNPSPRIADDAALDAALDLLDHQILDCDGIPVGKVEDLELAWSGPRPSITALLIGAGPFGSRMPGLLGRLVVAVWTRLRPEQDPQPVRIPLAAVDRIDSSVHLNIARDGLGLHGPEEWARVHIIAKLPGERHAGQ
jgi:sporulation protein YlmC with PRC-barrel domain